MKLDLAAALIYWVVVTLWLVILATVVVHYIRNPRIFGTMRLLLLVIAIDTCRNIIENTYFGLLFGSQYGLFAPEIAGVLGYPAFLIIPKLTNIAAGCFVLGLLFLRWLPNAIRERNHSQQLATDLQALSRVDGLTALFNRRHFDALARTEWARFQRYGRPLSLLVIDVDEFKSINDRFGHDAGDVILKAVADSCASARREADIVARFGGEEFCLLLPETDESAAMIVAERLRLQIQNHSHAFGDDNVQVSVSIGVCGASLRMPTFALMLKRADEALYLAKRTGRNRVMRAPLNIDETQQNTTSAILAPAV
jgi:diguanylate cyclase (GGDEF)-like protein